jgi:pimeloyl-ACP methyl ester carboxylesterase
MRKKRFVFIALVLFVFLIGFVFFHLTIQHYYHQAGEASIFEQMQMTRGISTHFSNQTNIYEILVKENGVLQFAFWNKALTGNAQVSIRDSAGTLVYEQQGRDINLLEELPLNKGHYFVELELKRYSGSVRIGFADVTMLLDLPLENYRTVKANPDAGFYWNYLLYLPDSISSPTMLVIPNNTGYEEDEIDFHLAEAQNLIKQMSSLSDELGTALLVPVFPRPDGELSQYYTHNLDRNALLMDVDGYLRLDLQLLAMIDDARSRLNEDGIATDEGILLWGYSASGTFSDRFTLLHPERVKAVAAGGCTHSLPFAEYGGENLPYPIGTYDYETITGHPFDQQAFAAIPRFLYKGDQDTGGTQTVDGITYPANQYFELFIKADLEARVETFPAPIVPDANMTYPEEEAIKYRIYHGAVFVDEFLAVESIYEDAGLGNTQFKLYEGVGHEVTDEMRGDVLTFFRGVLE